MTGAAEVVVSLTPLGSKEEAGRDGSTHVIPAFGRLDDGEIQASRGYLTRHRLGKQKNKQTKGKPGRYAVSSLVGARSARRAYVNYGLLNQSEGPSRNAASVSPLQHVL